MISTRLGQTVRIDTSYLLRSKTVKGEPVLRVDRDKDYKVGDEDEALVIRSEKDGKWDWNPVSDVKQLQDFLAKASVQDKSEHLGLWTDSRRWVVIPRDGIIQDDEVVTMGQASKKLQRVDSGTHYNNEYEQNDSWRYFHAGVDPSRLEVEHRQTATGVLAVFKEPQVIRSF